MKEFPADEFPVDELPDTVVVNQKPHHLMHQQLHKNLKAVMQSIPSDVKELDGWEELAGSMGTPGQPRYSGDGAPNPANYPDAVPGRDVYLDRTTGDLYTFS